MRKNYLFSKGLLTLALVGAMKMSAQLSGTVTINSAQATGGTNYQTFSALAADVNTAGISGPLYVDVVPNSGPYNEQPVFSAIPGTSSQNHIMINGNGNLLTFNSSNLSTPHTLLLNNVDYMDVMNLQIEGTNTSYAMVCILTNGSDYNTFTACTFSAPVNGTSSYHVPFAFNSSTGGPTSGGNPGNNNTITSCTLQGGYYGIFHYGLSSNPYTNNNSFIGCRLKDFYYYGIYAYYAKNLTIKGCEIDRPTRTSFSSTYLMMGYYNQGLTFDSNTIHDLWASNPSYTGTYYGMYYIGYLSPDPSNRNKITNNIFRNLYWNGTGYWFYYNYNSNNDYWHNTLSCDNPSSTTNTQYIFMYCYGSGSNFNTWKNNNFTVTRAGSGTTYCLYFGGNTTGSQIDYNNFWITSTNGYPGYWSTQANNFAAWQSQGPDVNGTNIDPMYLNYAAGDLHPSNTNLNNLGTPLGVYFDNTGAVRNQSTPDMGALEFLTPNCASTPSNSITGPSYSLCPGEAAYFNVNNLSSDLGITYQWQYSSISNVGPFTPISGANGFTLAAPNQTAQGWYSAIITCTAAGGGSVAPVWQVNISGPTTSQIPYFEGFEGIGLNNRAPNCSWSIPGLGNTANTFTSAQSGNRIPANGSSYGVFNNNTTNPNHMYTNAIQMNAGVVYSASVLYQSDLTGATNWSDLSILVGPNQSTTGLTSIVSTNGPAVSAIYKLLGGTFTVATSGTYYVAVRATGASGTAQFLSIDDLRIEIPCSVAANQPSVTVTAANATICTGNNAVLTANGANSYLWAPGGATTAINNDQPVSTTIYTVTGKNTITGCDNSTTIKVTVKPSPVITAMSVPALVCEGKTAFLSASGASTYTWAAGGTGSVKTVTVTGAANYSVIGTGTNGCQSSAVVAVASLPSPSVTANVSAPTICVGETVTLNAAGAITYQWVSTNPAVLLIGTGLSFYGTQPAAYSWVVTGTDNNGCENSTTVNLTVDACAGLNEAGASSVKVFPNPTNGVLHVSNLANNSEISILDITGRVVYSNQVDQETQINLSNFVNGVYTVRVNTNGIISVDRIIKN